MRERADRQTLFFKAASAHEITVDARRRRPDEPALAVARCPVCAAQADAGLMARERRLDRLAYVLEGLDALDSATASVMHRLLAVEDVPEAA